jgi:hypothetical protein
MSWIDGALVDEGSWKKVASEVDIVGERRCGERSKVKDRGLLVREAR